MHGKNTNYDHHTAKPFVIMKDSGMTLRTTEVDHLKYLFAFQLDQEARYMAAFTPKDAHDEEAYIARWTRLLHDPTITMRSIFTGPVLAGSIAKFEMDGQAEITYWIDRVWWGRGIATAALQEFLKTERTRPLFGHVAFDNIGSQRVLEKCGFIKTGSATGFANARQVEIREFIYKLA
jgi:[ribosomal protein S5]-alanine N-acetyltransferase